MNNKVIELKNVNKIYIKPNKYKTGSFDEDFINFSSFWFFGLE